MNASYQASLVNRHIRRFTGYTYILNFDFLRFQVASILPVP